MMTSLILTLNKSEGKPTISLTSSSRWETWTKAFLVFSTIYTERYPAEAPQLFKYISVVREMAYQKKPWLSYDKQFRLLKATNTAQWNDINYIRQRSWANVMYSPLFVCLSVCLLAGLLKKLWTDLNEI